MMEAMVKLFITAVVLVLIDWYSDRCRMCITTVEMMDNRRKEMAPTLYIKWTRGAQWPSKVQAHPALAQ